MVTSQANSPVKETCAVDDAIAREIDAVVQRAQQNIEDDTAQKPALLFSMPMAGVKYYSVRRTSKAA